MAHFLNINAQSTKQIIALVERSLALKQGAQPVGQTYTVANLFFENSTRTATSFQMAEHRLGWQVIDINPQNSSMSKGESLADTLKTIKAIGVDVAVVRHAQTAWYEHLDDGRHPLPTLVNAGDGSGQHPSQSLLDLVTIYEHFGHFQGLKIRIVGDLAHSRVAHSNAEIFQRLGASITLSGPEIWHDSTFEKFGDYVDLDDQLDQVDVLMFLRVQHERITNQENQSFSALQYHQAYGLTQERYQRLRDNAIIMHPGPVNRDVEIASDLVEAPKSKIFEQMTNGVYARMAMLESIQSEVADAIN
ncbi:aspartate carbamoyltransferase catalytic subunit [Convivina praedatoris]|uniref:Aspartate carbamoyltransferase n=1 Tax=Convivina praedatoris TaxID=2880963 RepID=A0ABM9D1V8_9LACO|nr:aspartate carbamoyltransferase catalytic subunit [Convivina sp. LMG 32447]CAH1852272.1 Aspartate carbamoyltransferase [Convivina sp. LMG 32447]CAH1853644.1 Aspartate carbamoyltransferase [Convivina sp. LMG 32447]CAH1854416.1 Aspartate carbamoyltransferase [Convivina sp. LMG 32447]